MFEHRVPRSALPDPTVMDRAGPEEPQDGASLVSDRRAGDRLSSVLLRRTFYDL